LLSIEEVKWPEGDAGDGGDGGDAGMSVDGIE